VVDLASKRVVGAEALARWSDEDGLPVSPDIFVRIAEKNGFVGEIAKLVVRHVLADFGPVLRGPGGFRISVNVAAADLADPEFLLMLERALTQEQVEAQRIVIEITEGSTVKNHVAMETIRLLRQRGHFVHIDDFGTGYSSLSYLQDLSVDAIKIDKAFTQAIGTGSVTVAILPQILAMAESLNLGVIVEGVETGEQADYFAAGPKPVLVQGWLFGRPVPAAEFHKRLQDDAKKAVGEPRIALVSGSAA
jgi:sensor c-di-GMP phosphodiesterase-like protein